MLHLYVDSDISASTYIWTRLTWERWGRGASICMHLYLAPPLSAALLRKEIRYNKELAARLSVSHKCRHLLLIE